MLDSGYSKKVLSLIRRCFISYENAQKRQKNDQKSAFFWSFEFDLTGIEIWGILGAEIRV